MKCQMEMAFFVACNFFLVHWRVHRCLSVLGLVMVAAVSVMGNYSEPREIGFEQNTS